jgi:hypothetical protein
MKSSFCIYKDQDFLERNERLKLRKNEKAGFLDQIRDDSDFLTRCVYCLFLSRVEIDMCSSGSANVWIFLTV